MNKYGISPLIATVLIIGFTVALGAVIMTWGSGFVKDMQEKSEISQAEAELKIQTSTDINKLLVNADGTMDLVLENVGSKETNGYLVRVEGDNEIETIEITEGLSVASKKVFNIDFNYSKIGNVKSVEVIAQGDLEGRTIKGATRTSEFTGAIDTSNLEQGQVLWLKLDNDYSDSSNNGDPLSCTSCPTYNPEGLKGGAYDFDGSSNYLISTISDWGSGDSLGSVSAWIYINSFATNNMIIGSADTSGPNNRFWTFSTYADGKLAFSARNGGTQNTIKGDTVLNTGEWYHVVVTSDGIAWKLWVNGVAQTLSIPQGANTGDWTADITERDNLFIGALVRTTIMNYFAGTIDDVRVWNRVLNTDEITYLTNN